MGPVVVALLLMAAIEEDDEDEDDDDHDDDEEEEDAIKAADATVRGAKAREVRRVENKARETNVMVETVRIMAVWDTKYSNTL